VARAWHRLAHSVFARPLRLRSLDGTILSLVIFRKDDAMKKKSNVRTGLGYWI
jgi:hypothetical protein